MKCLIVEMPYCLINAFPETRPRASAFQLSAFNFSLQRDAVALPRFAHSLNPALAPAPFSFQLSTFSFSLSDQDPQ